MASKPKKPTPVKPQPSARTRQNKQRRQDKLRQQWEAAQPDLTEYPERDVTPWSPLG